MSIKFLYQCYLQQMERKATILYDITGLILLKVALILQIVCYECHIYIVSNIQFYDLKCLEYVIQLFTTAFGSNGILESMSES